MGQCWMSSEEPLYHALFVMFVVHVLWNKKYENMFLKKDFSGIVVIILLSHTGFFICSVWPNFALDLLIRKYDDVVFYTAIFFSQLLKD